MAARKIKKLTDEQRGQWERKLDELRRQMEAGRVSFDLAMEKIQEWVNKGLYPVIDCDADPFIPDGWKVEEHQKGGIVKWTESLIGLYLDQGQNGKCISGNDLRQALQTRKVLNANVLDFLLEHPELIPEEWEHKAIFFWGTIYRGPDGILCVRCLFWAGDGWYWDYFWLGSDWDDNCPAAVLEEAAKAA